MAHDEKILRQSMEQFEEDRQRRREAFARHREQIFREIPRLEEIDRELKGAMSKIIASSLKRGTDPLPALRVIRDKNLDLQRERSALLMEHGYEADELEEKPDCVLCGDTGFRYELHRNARVAVRIFQIINELREILDRIDIMVRRR